MIQRSIVFRCDAGPTIGGGHAMRCLTLADMLAAAGWRILFALGADSISTIPALARYPHIAVSENAGDEPRQIAVALGGSADWLVADHYGRDAVFERQCRPWAKRIMVIDDLADRTHDCDLLLDQTFGRKPGDYAALVPPHCRLLMGPDFALLRPQFAACRASALVRRTSAGPARRLLLSFGAADPTELTSRVLGALLAHSSSLTFDVVGGAGPPGTLTALALEHPGQVTLHAAVDDMASLMLAADLAVGAGGTTSWERCTLGLPAAIVVTAHNQRSVAQGIAAAGAAIVLGDAGHLDHNAAAMTILRLAESPEQLAPMSTAAFRVCDGQGAARVAGHVVAYDPVNV